MAKISRIFSLNKDQYELDFLDVDPKKDTRKFIDAYWISKQENLFTTNCNAIIKNFFTNLLYYIKQNKLDVAATLCSYLSESGDVCLGYSTVNGTQGSGMGKTKAENLVHSLKNSDAVKSDMLVSIEDIKIFIEDIGIDNISDMIANIIRSELIEYTKIQCNSYGIPLTKANTSHYWDPNSMSWERDSNIEQLIIDGKRVLLIPKSIVMDKDEYSAENFIRNYVFKALQEYHLNNSTSLIQERKNGEKFVTKKSIEQDLLRQYGKIDKKFCERFSKENPEIFNNFKENVVNDYSNINYSDLLDEFTTRTEKAKSFIEKLKQIPLGKPGEDEYHDTIYSILVFILGTNIAVPSKEVKIHDGRKRIDIAMLNNSKDGVLYNLPNLYKITMNAIIGECKNYSNDVNNPEIDQISGRFSPRRAQCGFLLIRQIDNKDLLIKRCKDTYKDDRGLIVPITDLEIIQILEGIISGNNKSFDDVINKIIFEIMN